MKDFQNPPDPVSQVLGITSMCQHAQPKTHLYLYGFTHRKSDFKTESVTKQKGSFPNQRNAIALGKHNRYTWVCP